MSLWLKIPLLVGASVVVLAVLSAAVRSRKPVRSLLTSGAQGLCALGLVNVVGTFTGVSLGVGWLTAGTCFTLGIPGVISLLLLKIIFPAG
ncbi:MAG: pro-sigmaK processing inhibitor BofA family protein [Clostridia bacterium]|nr:pro-sigmaK processing inhibitor BofA family protein [Clostridia bacterium]